MDDAVDICAAFVNLQMQQNFASSLPMACELVAVEVDNAQIIGFEKALAIQRRCAEHTFRVETHGDVSFVGRAELPLIHAAADFTNFLSQLVLAQSFSPGVNGSQLGKGKQFMSILASSLRGCQ